MLLQVVAGLLLQTEPVVINTESHFLTLITDSDLIIKLTMVVLVIFSVVSWAVILVKHKQLKRIDSRNKTFYQKFWNTNTINELIKGTSFKRCPAFNVFKAGMEEIRQHGKTSTSAHVNRNIRRSSDDEVYEMEGLISFLATTATVTPFIGLFGTVWGILLAFWRIGVTGSSSLVIVGPHIAGALFTTALGLLAAIPAVVFYNMFIGKIRSLTKDIADFSEDLHHRVEKEYFEK